MKAATTLSFLLFFLMVGPVSATRRTPCWMQTYFYTFEGLSPRAQVASQILDYWPDFSEEAMRVALAVFGESRSRGNQLSLRDAILPSGYSLEQAAFYADIFRTAVQTQINDVYLGPKATWYNRLRLDGFATEGVVLVLHQSAENQKATGRLLAYHPGMAYLPRLAIADEENPVTREMAKELSAVAYWRSDFDPKLLSRMDPYRNSFHIHLMGGYFTEALARNVGAFAKRIASDPEVELVQLTIHSQVSYVIDPVSEIRKLSLNTALTRDPQALDKWVRTLSREFGGSLPVYGEDLEPPGFSFSFRRPDQKVLSINVEPKI